jgi:hypothetical protein
MNLVMSKPNLKSISGRYHFALDYQSKLEDMAVGESIIVGEFIDKKDLRDFARKLIVVRLMLEPHMADSSRTYEHIVNEKSLTYMVRRIE